MKYLEADRIVPDFKLKKEKLKFKSGVTIIVSKLDDKTIDSTSIKWFHAHDINLRVC